MYFFVVFYLENMQKVVRFAVQNLKANHNKDYSVVKTFSADVLSLFLGHSFSFCTIGYGVWVRNRGKQKALRKWFLRAFAERTRFFLRFATKALRDNELFSFSSRLS